MSEHNQPNSGRTDEELDGLINSVENEIDSAIEDVYVPKLNIRPKRKHESMRALGARVPTSMISDLKMLADYHDTNVEDMVAGILESVLADNMEAVYKKTAQDARKKLKQFGK